MNNNNIEDLISLLSNAEISKEDLVSTINKIQFNTVPCEAESLHELEPSISYNESTNLETCKGHSLTTINELDRNHLSVDGNLKQYEADKSSLYPKLHSMTTQGFSSPAYNESRLMQLESLSESSQFFKRLNRYMNNKEMKRKNLEMELRKQEEKECSFQPKINFSSKQSSKYRDENWRKMDMEQLQLEKKEREKAELVDCTFKPIIYSKDGKAKYMEPNKFYVANPYIDNEQEFTFRPNVGSSLTFTNSQRIQDYISMDAYKRLSQASNKIENNQEKATQPKVQDANKKIENFYLRQYEYDQRCQQRKRGSISNTSFEFKPTINEKSKEIMKRLNNAGKRYKSPINKHSEYEDTFTFQPEILPISKQRSPKTLEEMSMLPYLQKELKIKKLRKEQLENEAKLFTFQPALIAPPFLAQSKLQLLDHIETYLDRISKEEESKERVRKVCREVKEAQEMKECTHIPKVNSYCLQYVKPAEIKSKTINKYSKQADKI